MSNIKNSLPWLVSSCSRLSNYIIQKRIPQALLITGCKGIGKHQLAEHFAQSLMCSSPSSHGVFCGQCKSCRLFGSETHPDFISVQAEDAGKVIGISIIRQLITKLSLKPQFENYRVVIINPADYLTNAASNAFLKYLEEPTERTCLVLITDKPSKLPATIISRCQKIVISVPGDHVLIEWLRQQGVTEKTDLILSLAKNSPLLAKQFSDSSLLKLREDCFKQWHGLICSEANLVEVSGYWSKFEKIERDLLLFWITSWVIDIIKLFYQPELTKIYNLDLVTNLQELAQKLDLKYLFKYYDFLLLNQQRFDTQLNRQLMFEEILIRWIQLNNRK